MQMYEIFVNMQHVIVILHPKEEKKTLNFSVFGTSANDEVSLADVLWNNRKNVTIQ